MDAKIRIDQLTSAEGLSNSTLFVVQDAIEGAETKKATMNLLKTWLGALNFSDLSSLLAAGTGIDISIGEDSDIITISSTALANKWFIGETQPTPTQNGDLWLLPSGQIFSSEWADVNQHSHWIWNDTGVNIKGEKGFSPSIEITEIDDGFTFKVVNEDGEQSATIVNGVSPRIDETSGHWFIGTIDTGVKAKGETGQDGVSPVIELTENTDNSGYVLYIKDATGETQKEIHHGEAGLAASITIGNVEMTAAGTQPVIENVGTPNEAILNFKIPKGVDGGGSIIRHGPYILPTTGWTATRRYTVEMKLDTTNRNVIDIEPESLPYWSQYNIYPIAETSSSITFYAYIIPTQELIFYVTSMGVTYDSDAEGGK